MKFLNTAFLGSGLLLQLAQLQQSAASPTFENPVLIEKHARSQPYERPRHEKPCLRVMPLGASITAGDPEAPGDTEKNGYRKAVRDQLRFDGFKVDMVGDKKRGNMADNDHEGIGGETVSAVAERGRKSVAKWQPNIVLINAGTNDALRGSPASVNSTALRMNSLIMGLLEEAPNTTIVLSTLLANGVAQRNVDIINDGYRQLAQKLAKEKRRVILADMAGGFIPYNEFIQPDKTHPTLEGFRRMASVWIWAINQANERGWLSASEQEYVTGKLDCPAGEDDVAEGEPLPNPKLPEYKPT